MDLSSLWLFSSFHLNYLTLPCGIIPWHRLSYFRITFWKLIKPFKLSWTAYIRIISSFSMTILSHCGLLHFDGFGWDSTFIPSVVLATHGFTMFSLYTTSCWLWLAKGYYNRIWDFFWYCIVLHLDLLTWDFTHLGDHRSWVWRQWKFVWHSMRLYSSYWFNDVYFYFTYPMVIS